MSKLHFVPCRGPVLQNCAINEQGQYVCTVLGCGKLAYEELFVCREHLEQLWLDDSIYIGMHKIEKGIEEMRREISDTRYHNKTVSEGTHLTDCGCDDDGYLSLAPLKKELARLEAELSAAQRERDELKLKYIPGASR